MANGIDQMGTNIATMITKHKENAAKSQALADSKESALKLTEKIKEMGGDSKTADLFAEGIAGITDPKIANQLMTAAITNFTQQVKDKTDFQQSMQTEGFKAKMSFIPEITKSMAQSGMYSPEQIQEFAGIATEKAQSGIAGRINQATQSPQTQQGQMPSATPETSQPNELFSNPLPAKKSAKQKDYEDILKGGLQILDETESTYEDISKKYGTGRVKGLMTEFRGKLGDLLPAEEQAPEVVPYLNNLEGLANFIGKTIYKDERVSDVNIKGYKKALAELTNTPAEAKIMFATLRKYANSNSVEDKMALRRMLPNKGKGMLPSEATKTKMTREEKIAEIERIKASRKK